MFPGAYGTVENGSSERLQEDDDDTSSINQSASLNMPSLASSEDIPSQDTPTRSNRKRRRNSSTATEEMAPLELSNTDRNDEEVAESPAFSPHVYQSLETDGDLEHTNKIRRLEQELEKANEQLVEAHSQIKDQAEQILCLKEQIVTMGNAPECVSCGNGPEDQFFCSPKCQKNYERGIDLSDSDSD